MHSTVFILGPMSHVEPRLHLGTHQSFVSCWVTLTPLYAHSIKATPPPPLPRSTLPTTILLWVYAFFRISFCVDYLIAALVSTPLFLICIKLSFQLLNFKEHEIPNVLFFIIFKIPTKTTVLNQLSIFFQTKVKDIFKSRSTSCIRDCIIFWVAPRLLFYVQN